MKKAFLNIVIIICLAVFAVCAYQLIQYFYGNMEADKAFDKQRDMVADATEFDKRLPEYKKMKEQNEDFVGWIIADGTNVNNPVVQTVNDPEYYLYRDFNKNDSKPGTIFLSNVADLDEPTDIVTVFGHNMKDGTMFGSLRRYEDSEFLAEHDRIWMDSLEGRREFQVTNVMRIRVGIEGQEDPFPYYQYSNFKNEKEFNEFADQCKSYTLYDTGRSIEYGDKMVVLSTCEYTYGDGSGRLVIMGKEVKEEATQDMGQADITKPMMGTYVMIGIAVAAVLILLMLITGFVKGRKRKKAAKKAALENE